MAHAGQRTNDIKLVVCTKAGVTTCDVRLRNRIIWMPLTVVVRANRLTVIR